MWLEIVKSKLTMRAKALLTLKYINKDIKHYEEIITHDGNCGEYFESNIYTLNITYYENQKYYKHIYMMENWFDKTPINYFLYDSIELG